MADVKALAEELVNLSVKDVQELAKVLKEEYGIEPAAAAVAVAAPVAGGDAAAAEQTEFDVILKSAGDAKLNVIKAVKDLLGLGLKEAKELVANGCFCVAEGANMPSTPEAIVAFQSAGLLYAPGKASNAGGVATSGLEMTQNSIRQKWTAEEVDAQLHRIMKDIHSACLEHGVQDDGYVNYVKGANISGFMKVANSMLDQGLV